MAYAWGAGVTKAQRLKAKAAAYRRLAEAYEAVAAIEGGEPWESTGETGAIASELTTSESGTGGGCADISAATTRLLGRSRKRAHNARRNA